MSILEIMPGMPSLGFPGLPGVNGAPRGPQEQGAVPRAHPSCFQLAMSRELSSGGKQAQSLVEHPSANLVCQSGLCCLSCHAGGRHALSDQGLSLCPPTPQCLKEAHNYTYFIWNPYSFIYLFLGKDKQDREKKRDSSIGWVTIEMPTRPRAASDQSHNKGIWCE